MRAFGAYLFIDFGTKKNQTWIFMQDIHQYENED